MPKGAPPFLKNIKIPGLAQGSVLNGGDPFLAYLNDQPRGQTNIEAPLSTMVSAFKQALSEGDIIRLPQSISKRAETCRN